MLAEIGADGAHDETATMIAPPVTLDNALRIGAAVAQRSRPSTSSGGVIVSELPLPSRWRE